MATEAADPDMAAAELALGLLDGEERSAAQRRELADRAFAAEVAWWRERLAALFAIWPAEPAPPGVEARLFRALADRDGTAAWWRAATVAAGLVAAVSLGMLVRERRQPAPPPHVIYVSPPPLIAAIAPVAKGTPLAAVYDSVTADVRVAGRVAVAAPRSAQLWVIGGDGVPRPLGLLAATGETSRVRVPAAARSALVAGAALAVSAEPAGGSPTGKPTGPIVAKGVLVRG